MLYCVYLRWMYYVVLWLMTMNLFKNGRGNSAKRIRELLNIVFIDRSSIDIIV